MTCDSPVRCGDKYNKNDAWYECCRRQNHDGQHLAFQQDDANGSLHVGGVCVRAVVWP